MNIQLPGGVSLVAQGVPVIKQHKVRPAFPAHVGEVPGAQVMCADGPATPMVRPGDPVTAGQPIARRGQTGATAHASVSGALGHIDDQRIHLSGGFSDFLPGRIGSAPHAHNAGPLYTLHQLLQGEQPGIQGGGTAAVVLAPLVILDNDGGGEAAPGVRPVLDGGHPAGYAGVGSGPGLAPPGDRLAR